VLVNVVENGRELNVYGIVLVKVVAPPRPRHEPDDDEQERESPTTTPTPTGSTGGTGVGGVGTGSTTGTSTPRPVQRPPSRRAPRSLVPAGEEVSGTLLASTTETPFVPAGGVARATSRSWVLRLPTGVWVTFGVLALLAVGWASESRHTLPFWRADRGK
jgi:hypothetical protein